MKNPRSSEDFFNRPCSYPPLDRKSGSYEWWTKIFHDKVLTMALLDRITYNTVILNMND